MSVITSINNELLKKMIIVFWTLWWLIAFFTDFFGILAHFSLLKSTFAKDINYPSMVEALSIYPLPSWVAPLLFLLLLIGLFVISGMFLFACLSLHLHKQIWMQRARYAFVISLNFWFLFFIADQVLLKFDLEQNHMVQGGFEFLCFLALYILPNDNDEEE